MTLTTEFEDEMRKLSSDYYVLIEHKEELDERIKTLREKIQTTLSKHNRDKFDDPDSPVTVSFRMQSTGERMKRGAKDRLKEMLSPDQWREIYNPPKEVPRLVIRRKD